MLGFRTSDQTDGIASFTAGDGSGGDVVILVERKGAKPVPPRGRLGLFHVAYLLPDRASLGRFLRHVAESQVQVGMSDHLVSEAIYLSDPDGLGIEVYADRPRSTWQVEDSQIAMSTLPMNVKDVLEASGGISWSGAPSGTMVGHVHLHVGDLRRAENFFHRGLGLDKIVWTYPGALFMSAGGYHHHLGTNTWAAGASAAGDDEAKLLEWNVVVPSASDIDDIARNLESREIKTTLESGELRTADPWGTAIRISTPG